ncbi:MAG: hypothetical protein B7X76_00765 [Azorhizobium sp. 39-67-5]|nr:MAG: hypothetical protein B7Y95_20780 [Rhizobiales bacterium 32-66-11]OYY87427.1 MAG: hypothetical protein B7Y61_04920 [Rhizobiales bacterium 35-66-30]OZA92149.1 MAG: hypothetical protein B7X76_00765 [Azorhizobium sp. 39-67-5]
MVQDVDDRAALEVDYDGSVARRPPPTPIIDTDYLSRYTHRVAISNSRLLTMDARGVTFRWKDYRARAKASGNGWIKAMTLPTDEFIRRFLLHVLPDGFHRIRHYGLFASAVRGSNIERIRTLLAPETKSNQPAPVETGKADDRPRCRCCGGIMTITETFARGSLPRTWSAAPIRIDTS